MNNYGKLIFKGSLALECYYDDTSENKELIDSFNNELRHYRSLDVVTDSDKERVANIVLETIEKIGKEKFTIYEDGDVEYNYGEEGDEF